jgi:LysM repeat protein
LATLAALCAQHRGFFQAPEQIIVAEGDSLSRIAIRKGIAVEAMIAANPQLSDPMRLYPGDTVNLPKAAAAPAE